jgi:hypothetical protein
MKHIIATGAIAAMLAGCTTMGDVEKQSVWDSLPAKQRKIMLWC